MFHHCGRTGVLSLLALTLAPLAQAMSSVEADVERLAPLSLMELIRTPLVTASRQQESRDQTPSHIIVVTRQQIRERRYKSLADLLQDMPGVDFMAGTKSSQYNQFTVQGYTGPNKLVIMLDGVRLGQPAGGSFPVAENLSLYAAKQVEFLYGPAAALYGADAVAGVVNIITEPGAQTQSWVSAGVGNFGSSETSFMASGRPGDALALSVGGHTQQSARAPLQQYYPAAFAKTNATTFGGAVVVPASAREDYVGGISSHSLFARMDVGQNLTVGFYRNQFNSLTSTGDTPATALYLDDAQWITRSDTYYGKYRFDLTPDLSGELVLDYAKMEVDPRAKYVNIYNNFVAGYSYSLGERKGVEQNFNWRLGSGQRVQAGVGYEKYYAIETSSLSAPYNPALPPGGQGYVYLNTNLPQSIYSASFHNASAYAQWQADWNERLSTTAGVRVDQHSSYGTSVNPRLGAVWRADEQHVFKALYGEAFRAPSPEEVRSGFGTFDGTQSGGLYVGNGFRIPNFNLEPEKARTLSLTWDWRPRSDFNLLANLYHSQIRNLVVTQTVPGVDTTSIPGAMLINPEAKGNAGRQVQTGLDLMSQWCVAAGPGWSADLWGSASWIRGSIDEGTGTDWDIGLVASHKFKLGATLRYRDQFTITPQVWWVGDTTNGRKSATAPQRLITPGYTLTNLHLGWHNLLDGKATLWLDVYNLWDARYYAAHGSASRTFFNMPQQPRSWMLSLEYRF